MYKTKRRVLFILTELLIITLIIFLSISIIPVVDENRRYSSFFTWITTSVLVISVLLVLYKIEGAINAAFKKRSLLKNETKLLSDFIDRLKYCYSFDEFYKILGEVLEIEGDCSILFVDKIKNFVLYNSPDRLTTDKNILSTLDLNFSATWADGVSFLGSNYGIVNSSNMARGFFLVYKGKHLYVFCKYTKSFDTYVYKELYEEYCNFLKRTSTISDLSEIAALSQEWQQLANTQRSFLPPVMPSIAHLELAAYFRPLINVSGDYYSVLPISNSKTLLMLGDVSGKGLAAALVMGLVMNTVKILEDKDDLVGMIRAVDKAIKGMHLQDKYTVLFLGIVDTSKMVIRYVNASMSDPIVITKAAD